MQSLSFHPGRAFLSVNSPTVPWTVVFEDEGIAGYFYACDRSQTTQEQSILDAMLIYTRSRTPKPSASPPSSGPATACRPSSTSTAPRKPSSTSPRTRASAA
jgi:hypothetical protein